MSKNLVWVLGGGSAVMGVAVAGFLAVSLREDEIVQAPSAAPQGQTPDPAMAPAAGGASVEPARTAAPAPGGAVPAAQVAADASQIAQDTTPEPTPPDLAPPTFDVVRVARDGGALVAGAAAPGAAIALRVDGAVVAETVADGAGQFVSLFSLGFSEAPQVLTLEMSGADGLVVLSDDTVILTPRPAPLVANAAPEGQAVQPPQTAPETGTPERLASADGVLSADSAPPGDARPAGDADIQGAADTPVEPMGQAADLARLAPATAPPGTEIAAPAARRPPPAQSAPEPNGQAPQIDISPGEGALARDLTRDGVPSGTQPQDPAPPAEPLQADAAPLAAADASAAPDTPSDAAPVAAQPAADQPAETMPTAFLVRGSGAVQVLDRAPQVLDNVVIDSISYSAAGDVQIAGRAARAAPPSSLRIYLNNQPIAVAVADQGDWASDLPNVDPGVYTLRVDQLSAEGRVVSRFETPFQREDPALVVAAQAAAAGPVAPVADQASTPTATASAPQAVPQDSAASTGRPADTALVGDGQRPASTDTQPGQLASSEPQTPAPQPVVAPRTQDPDVPAPTAQTILAAPVAQSPVEPSVPQDLATRGTNPAPPAPAAQQPAVPPVSLITVQPGHTLWAISRDRYGAGELYVVIYRANRSQIRDPDLIYPGQIFSLPEN